MDVRRDGPWDPPDSPFLGVLRKAHIWTLRIVPVVHAGNGVDLISYLEASLALLLLHTPREQHRGRRKKHR